MEGFPLNKRRALEIAKSPTMENVTHNGNEIYIQHVDEENHTARVHPLDEPENKFDVQLESLHETD